MVEMCRDLVEAQGTAAEALREEIILIVWGSEEEDSMNDEQKWKWNSIFLTS